MSEGLREPVQKRSKDMLERLLQATIKTIGEVGIEGSTIPKIAVEAEIAPAGVYRRFEDKDALFQAAFLRALQGGGLAGKNLFEPSAFEELSLERALEKVVGALFRQYRAAPRFLKAFIQFYENHPDTVFRAKALAELRSNLQAVVNALRSCRELAGKPESDFTTKFGLLTIASSIEAMVLNPETLWTAIQPISGEEVEAEFVRLFLSYLRSAP